MSVVFENGRVFNGTALRDGLSVAVDGDKVVGIGPSEDFESERIDVGGDILCPKFVDLQVNGGGGVLFNDDPSEQGLARIAEAHRRAGTGAFLPTLITDTPEVTRRAIQAVANTKVPGVAGIHLEGPHLAKDKAGAHDPTLIRPLTSDDIALYLDAARHLRRLLITLAPETVPPDDIGVLANAGIVVSLGHSAAGLDTARAAFDAGATMATHLFNAMPPLHHREPGLVGAVLDSSGVAAGLIADGLHVHPAVLGAAFRAKVHHRNLFVVTDAMAPFGTDLATFELKERTVSVDGPRLALEDGTLAGANTDMLGALRILVGKAGIPLVMALRMLTRAPAIAARLPSPIGQLKPGSPPPLRIAGDLSSLKPLT